jgi:rubredoxin
MSRVLPKFRELPDDCTCLGEGPVPVSRVPSLGAMRELITYQCPACGHIETLEKQPNTPPWASSEGDVAGALNRAHVALALQGN